MTISGDDLRRIARLAELDVTPAEIDRLAAEVDEIVGYVNETALFRNQWQFRPLKDTGENDEDFKARIRPVLVEELAKAKEFGFLVPPAAWGS